MSWWKDSDRRRAPTCRRLQRWYSKRKRCAQSTTNFATNRRCFAQTAPNLWNRRGTRSTVRGRCSYTKTSSQKFGFSSPSASTWYARLPTTVSATPVSNVAIPLTANQNDGYIGLFLRVYTVNGVQATDLTTPVTTMQVALSMDVAADNTRTEQSQWRDIIADGEWHYYQWNLDNPADWTVWRDRLGNTLNNSTGIFPTAGNVWLDSVLLRGGNYSAEVLFDSIMINSAGTLAAMDYIPEPTVGAIIIGLLPATLRRPNRPRHAPAH